MATKKRKTSKKRATRGSWGGGTFPKRKKGVRNLTSAELYEVVKYGVTASIRRRAIQELERRQKVGRDVSRADLKHFSVAALLKMLRQAVRKGDEDMAEMIGKELDRRGSRFRRDENEPRSLPKEKYYAVDFSENKKGIIVGYVYATWAVGADKEAQTKFGPGVRAYAVGRAEKRIGDTYFR